MSLPAPDAVRRQWSRGLAAGGCGGAWRRPRVAGMRGCCRLDRLRLTNSANACPAALSLLVQPPGARCRSAPVAALICRGWAWWGMAGPSGGRTARVGIAPDRPVGLCWNRADLPRAGVVGPGGGLGWRGRAGRIARIAQWDRVYRADLPRVGVVGRRGGLGWQDCAGAVALDRLPVTNSANAWPRSPEPSRPARAPCRSAPEAARICRGCTWWGTAAATGGRTARVLSPGSPKTYQFGQRLVVARTHTPRLPRLPRASDTDAARTCHA
jgi:hypothetical protein